MVKRNKQLNEITDDMPAKKNGFFQVLLLTVIVPLLFTLAVVLIIAKVADVNVFDKAKEWTASIPFIGDKNEEKVSTDNSDDLVLEERVVTLQAEIQEKEAELFKLQDNLDKSSSENEKLLVEQEKLLEEIAVLMREKDDSTKEFKEIVSTFEKMSAKASAPVIMKMSDAEAIKILTNLKSDTLAKVLEKMPAENAAKYTTMMTK